MRKLSNTEKQDDLAPTQYELLKIEIYHLSEKIDDKINRLDEKIDDKINVVYWMLGVQFMFIAGIITYMLTLT